MKELFLQLAEDYQPMSNERHHVCDTWGVAMSLAFDVASVCYTNNSYDGGLGYSPGAGGVEEIEDEYIRETLEGMHPIQVTALAAYVNRVLDMLRHYDKDY